MSTVARTDERLPIAGAIWPFARLLACLAAAGCTNAVTESDLASTQADIEGGVAYARCDWPAVVSLGGCSGTLVHSRLVVYAAHCGTAMAEVRFGVDAASPDRVVATDFCGTYPGAKLGDGTDLAFCVLAQDVRDVAPARVLAGCEARQLEAGCDVELVGFGVTEPNGAYGLARAASATVTQVGDELLITGDSVDTCKGDSGGPVFMSLVDAAGSIQRRLVGVTSAGSSAVCGEGVAHYVNLAAKVAWLEDASGLDVTPCFDGNTWAPTPPCLSTGSTAAVSDQTLADCEQGFQPTKLTTCGAAWQPDAAALEPPTLDVTVPESGDVTASIAEQPFFETAISVQAEGHGAGIKRVTFTLSDAQQNVLLQRADEIPPYGLPSLHLPAGSYVLEAKAEDFAQQSAVDSVNFHVHQLSASTDAPNRGCAVTSPGASHHSALRSLALLVVLALKAIRPKSARSPAL